MVRWLSAGFVLTALAATSLAVEPGEGQAGADAHMWNQAVSGGVRYLRSSQAEDGSWSKERSLGITAVAVTGLIRSGVPAQDPVVEKALKFIESLVNRKEGHIAGQGPAKQLLNYVTSVNVMALVEAGQGDRYRKIVGDAADFLKKLQWDEGEGKSAKDDFYGGFGYDSKSRPDLSNSQIALDALAAAGIPKDDPALKRALVFVSRCQNLKGEYNDQPWAAKINDGSFIYSAAGGGQSKVEGSSPETGLQGYGSMTYAGIKSMIYCGVSPEDPRVTKAYEWIRKHYTVEANPGMPPGYESRGLYYYYHTMAKCLDTLGVDYIEDSQGKRHDWRAEVTKALLARQKPDGHWVNERDQWMEGDPNLVTGYALMALSYCRPRK